METHFRRFGRTTSYLMITDYLILVGTFGVALHLRRYDPAMDIISLSRWQVVPEVLFVMFFGLVMLGIFNSLGLYLRRTWVSRQLHLVGLVKATAIVLLGYILLRALTKAPFMVESRYVQLLWGVFLFGALVVHRLGVFPVLLRIASHTGLQRRVVLIGHNDLAQEAIAHWRANPLQTLVVPIGILSDKPDAQEIGGVPVLGSIGDLPRVVQEHDVEGAILTAPDLPHQELMDLIEQCIRLFGWVDVHASEAAVLHEKLTADVIFNIPFARLAAVPNNPLYLGYKRLMDLLLAGLGLLVLSPLLLAIVVLIKLTSAGPVLYAKERIGQDGRPFLFLKFRSMRVGADQDPDRLQKMLTHIQQEDSVASKIVDPAMVTPVGRFLRKWGLDEIPQLLNVLRGDLSLVGPRPMLREEYEAQAEWQKWRFGIKPGCTGLWKVMIARTAGATFSDSVLYDIYYARHMNPLLDLYILAQTAWIVASGRADG